MSSRLTTLASVLASVVSFATLHYTSSNVAYATDAEAVRIRAGDCYVTNKCQSPQGDCVNHCKDDGCELDTLVPYAGITQVTPPVGNWPFLAPCSDEFDCWYDAIDSTRGCTAP